MQLSPEQRILVTELLAQQIKVSPDQLVDIRRLPNGKIVFLEHGNQAAGLQHILKHSENFRQRGLSPSEIAEAILTALTQGQVVGYQRQRPIYAVNYRGTVQYLAITVSENGFIVGANPATVPSLHIPTTYNQLL